MHERDDLADKCQKLDERISNTKEILDEKIEDKYQRNVEALERESNLLNTGIEKANKDIDRLKFELVEVLDAKSENMQRQFELELQKVKQRYEHAIAAVDEAGHTIDNLFKKKVRAIKEKSAIFFAKLEMKLKENNEEVIAISSMFREW